MVATTQQDHVSRLFRRSTEVPGSPVEASAGRLEPAGPGLEPFVVAVPALGLGHGVVGEGLGQSAGGGRRRSPQRRGVGLQPLAGHHESC